MGWVCSTYWTDWRFTIKLGLVHKRNKISFFTTTQWQKIEKYSRLDLLLF